MRQRAASRAADSEGGVDVNQSSLELVADTPLKLRRYVRFSGREITFCPFALEIRAHGRLRTSDSGPETLPKERRDREGQSRESTFLLLVYGELNPDSSDDGDGWFPLRKFGLFLGEDPISVGTVTSDSLWWF